MKLLRGRDAFLLAMAVLSPAGSGLRGWQALHRYVVDRGDRHRYRHGQGRTGHEGHHQFQPGELRATRGREIAEIGPGRTLQPSRRTQGITWSRTAVMWPRSTGGSGSGRTSPRSRGVRTHSISTCWAMGQESDDRPLATAQAQEALTRPDQITQTHKKSSHRPLGSDHAKRGSDRPRSSRRHDGRDGPGIAHRREAIVVTRSARPWAWAAIALIITAVTGRLPGFARPIRSGSTLGRGRARVPRWPLGPRPRPAGATRAIAAEESPGLVTGGPARHRRGAPRRGPGRTRPHPGRSRDGRPGPLAGRADRAAAPPREEGRGRVPPCLDAQAGPDRGPQGIDLRPRHPGARREVNAEFRELAKRTPLTHHDLFTWALTHFTAWGPDIAGDLGSFIEADPDDRYSRLALANLLIDHPGEEARVARALQPLPDDDPEAQALRIELKLNHGQVDEALAMLARAPDRHPHLARLRGRVALRRGDASTAIRHFQDALRDEPYDRVSIAELGRALVLRGDRPAAERYLTAPGNSTRSIT